MRKGPGAGAGWEHGISGAGGGWGWGTEPRCSLHRPGTCPSPAGGAVEMGTEMAPWFLSLSWKKGCKTPKVPHSLVAQSCGHGCVQLRPAPAPGPTHHRSQERIEQISVFLLNHDL